MRLSLRTIEISLAALVVVLGVLGGLSTLGRGVWLDEFWTLVSTPHGQSASEFWNVMARDVHPPLHYGLIQVAQGLGITNVVALRALNIAGLALAGWAGWFAHRRGAVTTSQLALLAALYASSSMFLEYFAELRAYFLTYSASIATCLVWRVLMLRADAGKAWTPGLLGAWFVCLAIFVNLHYFATLLGGLLTLAVLAVASWEPGGARRNAIRFALVSFVAALPAIGMALIQLNSMDAGLVGWILTGRIDAMFVIADSAWDATAANIVAVACAVAAGLFLFERGEAWRSARIEVILASVICVFYAVLVAMNLVRPVVIDRYLVAAGGPIAVLIAVLAGGRLAPAWGPAAACAFAVLVLGRDLYSRTYQHLGWSESARAAAALVEACPGATLYIDPVTFSADTRMFVASKRLGLEYYAERLGLEVSEVGPGDTVSASGDCPSVVWLEHYTPDGGTPTRDVLEGLQLEVEGSAEVLTAGSGTLIVVR